MGNRTAKFISALFASVLAGAPLSAVSQNAASAPAAQNGSTTDDDCLGSPKGTAPQGQHWYYRIERGTKRQCWYLREEGAKLSQSTSAQTSATPTSDARTSDARTSDAQNAPSTAPTPKSVATPGPRSVKDARAEFTAQEAAPAPDTTGSITAPVAAGTPPPASPRPNVTADNTAQLPAIAARWPDAPNTAPAPQVAPANIVADAQPAPQPAASPAPVAPAAADVPAGKPTGSLQTLLLVIGGALALAGITASFIYRFAGAKARAQASERRRRVNWEQPADNAHAPWAAAAGALPPRARRPLNTERPRAVDLGIALATAATEMRAGRFEIKPAEPTHVAPEHDDDIEIETEAVDEQLEAIDTHVDETSEPDADAVDVDAITTILERLLNEGPRLSEPSSEAGFADFAQSRRGQSAARA